MINRDADREIPLSLGYSPCPNDTFIFTAWVEGRVSGPPVRERLEDIDLLNRRAEAGELDVAKVSFHALGYLRERYALLHSGGALGRGCGPLVVARESVPRDQLSNCRIAIPGRRTTAALLLRLFAPDADQIMVLPFHEIMPAVREGRVDAGLIIHESRFTYPRYGLTQIVDLGEWWEQETGHPIPLGGIVVRRSLPAKVKAEVETALSQSIRYAHTDPKAVWTTVRQRAQEMEDDVMRRHIELYVNEYTRNYGSEGEAALQYLFKKGEALEIFPPCRLPLFWDEEGTA